MDGRCGIGETSIDLNPCSTPDPPVPAGRTHHGQLKGAGVEAVPGRHHERVLCVVLLRGPVVPELRRPLAGHHRLEPNPTRPDERVHLQEARARGWAILLLWREGRSIDGRMDQVCVPPDGQPGS